jgi:preprotein translocase subunit YajC
MITTIVISALSVLVVILGFTTFNLMRKNEKQEDIMVEYMEYLTRLDTAIEESDKRL